MIRKQKEGIAHYVRGHITNYSTSHQKTKFDLAISKEKGKVNLCFIVEDQIYYIVQVNACHQVPSDIVQISDMFVKHCLFFFVTINGDDVGDMKK